MILYHLLYLLSQLKKKTKEDKKLMHSYLPFKNVPWVEIRPFAEWCAEVH